MAPIKKIFLCFSMAIRILYLNNHFKKKTFARKNYFFMCTNDALMLNLFLFAEILFSKTVNGLIT